MKPETAAFQEMIDQLVYQSLGTTIVSLEPFSSNVARARLSPAAGAPPTVIVKRGLPPQKNRPTTAVLTPEFLEEVAAYRFLNTLRPQFSHFPEVLAEGPGLLILEDLDIDPPEAWTAVDLAERLGQSLARLHAASAGKSAVYGRIRAEAGLGQDDRMYSQEQYRRLFSIGSDFFLNTIEALGFDRAGCQTLLAEVDLVLNGRDTPGVFLHDDLFSTRQFIMNNGRCYLIDFEMSKFGHPLLELSRSLAGKFDRKAGTACYILKHLALGIEMTAVYRQQLAGLGGLIFNDDAWNLALGSAFIYTTLVNLGAQFCVPDHFRPYEGLARTRIQVIERLAFLLQDNPCHQPLKPVIAALAVHFRSQEENNG